MNIIMQAQVVQTLVRTQLKLSLSLRKLNLSSIQVLKTFVQTTVKDLTTNIKSLTSLKYLNEYEIAIQEAFDELFAIETLIKREIIKYYIDNLYASSFNQKILN